MILGKITGKITTNEFKFIVEKETRKLEFIQVYHSAYGYILCQVIELETDQDKTIAYCQVIGYKDKGKVKKPRIPFDPGSEVLMAENDFIREVVKLEKSDYKGLLGKLDGKDIDVSLDLNKVLTMHLAVLAKSGSGKSYSVGVLLEEMITKKIPLVIIDPHGEYSSLKYKNNEEEETTRLKEMGLEPESFNVEEYGDPNISPGVKPIKLNIGNSQEELVNLLPGKITNTQLGLLYSAFKSADPSDLNSLILSLEQEESSNKYSVINMIEYLRDLDVVSSSHFNYADFVKQGKATVINLKGIDPEVQEMIVYKVSKELFDMRKKEKIPPFFLVVEEAHNYAPERSFGEKKSSNILRTIASEGRKFGLGLCVISQRPARVDKSVLSQCSTQMIMKITNPNDLKAVSNSVEGLTNSTEKEIQNLTIGQALITGITDMPLLVNIRPRKSLHGGTAREASQEEDFSEKLEEFEGGEFEPIIQPNTTPKDVKLMSEEEVSKVETILHPALLINCEDKSGSYKLLVEMENGEIVLDKDEFKTAKLPSLDKLSKEQVQILKYAFKNKHFKPENIEDGENQREIEKLVHAQYLEKENDGYKLSEKYIFSKLNKVQTHESIKHEQIPYHEKVEPKINKEKLLDKISKFTSFKNSEDCFIVRYKPVF